MLRAIAEARGIQPSASGQIDLVRELGEGLLQPDSVSDALALLTTAEREALDGLLAAGGKMTSALFQQRYGELRGIGDARLARDKPWIGDHTPAEGLWYLGFVFRAFAQTASRLEELVFVPTDLRPLLPKVGVVPRQLSFSPSPAPETSVPSEDSLALDLCSLLIRVQNSVVRPLKGYRLAADDAVELMRRSSFRPAEPEVFAGLSEARWGFLLRIVRRAHLAQLREGALKVNPRPARLWLNASRLRQMETLWKAWRDDASSGDLRFVPWLLVDAETISSDALVSRRRLLALLAGCEAGQWYRVSDVIAAIRSVAPDFLRTGVQFASWRISNAQGLDLSGAEHWNDVEGALIRYVVLGPMHWLGAVETGWVAGAPVGPAFALTPHGRAWLLRGRDPTGFAPAPLAVAPDGRVVSPRQGSLYQRFQLSRFADWESGGAEQCYRLTPQSLARAQAQGLDAESTLAFLDRASSGVPDEVRRAVQTWAKRHGRVRVANVTILSVDSPETITEIRRIPGVAALLGKPMGPLSIAVDSANWAELSRILAENGFL
jgi:hypothetical protein